MLASLARWYKNKWTLRYIQEDVRFHYTATFGSVSGQFVLEHLFTNIYCQVTEDLNPQAAVVLNARRTVIHEILEMIDLHESPMKYRMNQIQVAVEGDQSNVSA